MRLHLLDLYAGALGLFGRQRQFLFVFGMATGFFFALASLLLTGMLGMLAAFAGVLVFGAALAAGGQSERERQ